MSAFNGQYVTIESVGYLSANTTKWGLGIFLLMFDLNHKVGGFGAQSGPPVNIALWAVLCCFFDVVLKIYYTVAFQMFGHNMSF